MICELLLQVEVTPGEKGNDLHFLYRLDNGVLDSDLSYGIETANACGIPEYTIQFAKLFKEKIVEKEREREARRTDKEGYPLLALRERP